MPYLVAVLPTIYVSVSDPDFDKDQVAHAMELSLGSVADRNFDLVGHAVGSAPRSWQAARNSE